MTRKYSVHTFQLLAFLLIFSLSKKIHSQDSLLFSKKTYEFIAKGDSYKSCYSYNAAINQYQKALKFEPDNNYIKLRIANLYRLLRDIPQAEKWYSCLENDTIQHDPTHVFYYAMTLLAQNKYEKAREWFLKYNEAVNYADLRGTKYIQSINNLQGFYADSSVYVIKNLSFNTELSDFCPINIQNRIVYLTSDRILGDEVSQEYFDVYYTALNETGEYSKPKPLNKSINSKYHEGPLSYNKLEKKIYFTRNALGPNESVKDLDEVKLGIFHADFPMEWNQSLEIKPLNFEGFKNNMGHPALTEDCKKIVFVSDAPGGYGGLDLYMSEYTDSTWQYPVNLGPEINTKGDEMFPAFFKEDVLYFSSDGHGGLGGLDIYKVKLKENLEIENLKYPINSSADDFGITFISQGKSGFFTSNRSGGVGKDDIYSFELVKIKFLGSVFDIASKENIIDAKIIFRDKLGNAKEIVTDENGQFEILVDRGSEYSLEIQKSDFSKEELSLQLDSVINDHIGLVQIGLLQEKESINNNEILPVDTMYYGVDSLSKNAFTNHSAEEPEKTILFNGTQLSELEKDNLPFKIKYTTIIEKNLTKNLDQDFDQDQNFFFDSVLNIDKNIKYRVQIAACRKPLPQKDIFSKYKGDKEVFMFEEDGWFKYAIAEELSYQKAKKILLDCNVDDAFIAAYTDSEKLTLKQAISKQYSFSESGKKNLITETKVYDVKTISFDFNSFTLKEEYKAIINSDVIKILNTSGELALKIQTHTDIRGSNEYNLGLAEARAKEIFEYLIESGIQEERIELVPLGESMVPEKCEIEVDCNESIHSKNRIAELIIVDLK
jgi:outer membrane protein OmpA-like peptidoglycan-associated protein/acetyltransferase-like isoleucine patch superfamily enzyme